MLSKLVVLTLLSGSAFSAPAPALPARGITLPLYRRTDTDLQSPRRLVKRAGTSSTLDLGTADVAYFANLQAGTPSQTFIVTLDTGSSDLVLETAVQYDSCEECTTSGPLYAVNTSTTAHLTGATVDIQYGIGEDAGVVVTDTVTFGGYTGTQTIAACSRNSEFSNIGPITGLLGLGLEPLAATNSTPFVQALANSGQLAEPLFGLAFAAGEPNEQGKGLVSGGFMNLGFLNTSLYSGDMNFIDVSDSGASGYWILNANDVSIGGTNLGLSTSNCLIDTGTNSISVPSAVAAGILETFPGLASLGGGQYIYPNSFTPNLTFYLGGTGFHVPATSMCQEYNSTHCVSAVQDSGDDQSAPAPLWILGSPFIEAYYSAFRFTPPAIGFAPLLNPNKVLQNDPIPTLVGVKVGATTTKGGAAATTSASGGSGGGGTSAGSGLKVGLSLLVVAVGMAVGSVVL